MSLKCLCTSPRCIGPARCALQLHSKVTSRVGFFMQAQLELGPPNPQSLLLVHTLAQRIQKTLKRAVAVTIDAIVKLLSAGTGIVQRGQHGASSGGAGGHRPALHPHRAQRDAAVSAAGTWLGWHVSVHGHGSGFVHATSMQWHTAAASGVLRHAATRTAGALSGVRAITLHAHASVAVLLSPVSQLNAAHIFCTLSAGR